MIAREPMVAKREYRKRARADSELRTRRAIIEAAVACFSDSSFEQVTVADLAGRSGLSVQTLLRIHGTKEALFLAAVRAIAAEVIGKRDEAVAGDVQGALRVLVADYERWGDIHERLFARSRGLPELAAMIEAWRLHHRRWVRRIFADRLGPLPRPERDRLLATLVVALDIGTYRRLRTEGLSRNEAARALRRLLMGVLDVSISEREENG